MRKYIRELEDLIMDVLLPAYISHCRDRGIDPKSSQILAKLLKMQGRVKPMAALLGGLDE